MSDPQRIASIRRLFLAKLEKISEEMPYEERVECARKELDNDLGPMWREEVKRIDLDPTGEKMEEKADSFYDRLSSATREEGYHGDDVPSAPRDKKSIILKLMEFFHGK